MLIQFALIYAATWLVALCGALAVETARLRTTGRLAPPLDWTGALCFAWLVAPIAGPAWLALATWRWLRGGRVSVRPKP